MKNLIILLLAALLVTSPAHALLIMHKVTSESTEEGGITAVVKKDVDGTFTFTVTRYLKAMSPGPEWTIEGTNELEVGNGKGGVLCKTSVASEKTNDIVVYKFSLARDCVANTRFTMYENFRRVDDKDFIDLSMDLYEFDLPEIADRVLKASAPLHP